MDTFDWETRTHPVLRAGINWAYAPSSWDLGSGASVAEHLRKRPACVVGLYKRFAALIERQGPVTYRVTKTSITFKGTRRLFAGAKLTDYSLDGFLDLPRALEDPRIRSASPHTTRVFVNHFRVTKPEQMDETFASWVKEAYDVGAGSQSARNPSSSHLTRRLHESV